MIEQIDHRLARIAHLTTIIDSEECDLVKLKNRYDEDLEEKNQCRIKLTALDEDLMVSQDRLNLLIKVSAAGNTALSEKKDVLRNLELIGLDLSRKLKLQKRLRPVIEESKTNISRFMTKRDQLYKQLLELCVEMENSKDPKRCRNLRGSDPTLEVLSKRIERLEITLCKQEVVFALL